MDFDLTEDQRAFQATARQFAREAMAPTPETAAEAAARIGFPVVLKLVSPDVVHKSDVGAVRLGLTSSEAVAIAAREMTTTVSRAVPNARIGGFAVQATVRGQAEVIVGARDDPHFGAVVMVGLGGIAVEILKDVALAPAPVSPARARTMIDSLVSAPLPASMMCRVFSITRRAIEITCSKFCTKATAPQLPS